jgi:hypothetical protein
VRIEQMTDQNDQPQRRGEAAWKAHKADVATRNEAARKASREERKAHERRIADLRREARS